MSPVRIGVVGVGALALRGIIPHLTQDDVRDRVVVHALCDPVIDRAQASIDLDDEGVAPVIDWNVAQRRIEEADTRSGRQRE